MPRTAARPPLGRAPTGRPRGQERVEMDVDTTRPQPTAADAPAPVQDRLGAEVRESALLLVLSLLVTVGLASGVQALLALLA